MRLPTNSRQTETDTAANDRPATGAGAASTETSPVQSRPDYTAPTATNLPPAPAGRTDPPPPPPPGMYRSDPDRTAAGPAAYRHAEPDATVADRTMPDRTAGPDHTVGDHTVADGTTAERTPVVAGPKPRASLLATLGLILGVAAALLVLSGPLLGYGIGVAGLGLILSLAGLSATGKRHVAGKTDALIGMVLSLGAIVVGVLALTGSLSWLGTDMQPVTSVREWLDAQFVNRF